jgi:transposase-like protein
MTPPADPERYKNHRFPGGIISHGVWLYYRFPLSYRDVQELLFERSIDVTHEAIRQWCLKFGQDYANQLKHRRTQPGDKWHWKRNKKVAGHPCPAHLSVQDTRRREVALSSKR